MTTQNERVVQNAICDYLTIINQPFLVFDSKGSFDPVKQTFRKGTKHKRNGVADLILWKGNTSQVFFVEIKASKGVHSKNQKEFKKWVEDQGIKYYTWRSVDNAIEFMTEEYKDLYV